MGLGSIRAIIHMSEFAGLGLSYQNPILILGSITSFDIHARLSGSLFSINTGNIYGIYILLTFGTSKPEHTVHKRNKLTIRSNCEINPEHLQKQKLCGQ